MWNWIRSTFNPNRWGRRWRPRSGNPGRRNSKTGDNDRRSWFGDVSASTYTNMTVDADDNEAAHTMTEEQCEVHLACFRKLYQIDDEEMLDRVRLGLIDVDQDVQAWLVLLGHGDKIP